MQNGMKYGDDRSAESLVMHKLPSKIFSHKYINHLMKYML